MEYPVWVVPAVGGGFLIALVSIIHVLIAHFAVGGGLYLVITETWLRKRGDTAGLESLKALSRFFVLLTVVAGALTGVGVWWTIGLVHPSATSMLIHTFLWVWAIEWVFFAVEILAAALYARGWERLAPRDHVRIGWIYAISSWLSLVAINGILTFMLTPGRWTTTHSLWDAWSNPTSWPSLVMRTAISILLAGGIALVAATQARDGELRDRLVRWCGGWILAAVLAVPFASWWYFVRLPVDVRAIVAGGVPVAGTLAVTSSVILLLTLKAVVVSPMWVPRRAAPALAMLVAVGGLFILGAFEWVREAARKPFVITEVIYSNSMRPVDLVKYYTDGCLGSARWSLVTPAERATPKLLGAKVFRFQCQACHSERGLNSIRYATRGWTQDEIANKIQFLTTLKGNMPPFCGTDEERLALAAWIAGLAPEETTGQSGAK